MEESLQRIGEILPLRSSEILTDLERNGIYFQYNLSTFFFRLCSTYFALLSRYVNLISQKHHSVPLKSLNL